MKKLLATLVLSAALSLAGGVAQVHAEKELVSVKEDAAGVHKFFVEYKTDTDFESDTYKEKIPVWTKETWAQVGKDYWIIVKVEDVTDPDPFGSASYDDKPLGHKDSNPLVLGKGDPNPAAPAQKLAEWQQQFMDFMGGFSPQGKGSRDELINPDPFGGGGSAPKKPKAKPKGGLDPDDIYQKLGEMEESLQEIIPGLELDMASAAHGALINPDPAESQSKGGGDVGGPAPGGGGGPPPAPGSAAEATSSDKAGGKAPPNIKDAAMGALVNPDPLARNLPGPGNLGLPDGSGMLGPGAGGNQSPGAAGQSAGGQGGGSGPGGGFGLAGPGGGSKSRGGRRRLPKP